MKHINHKAIIISVISLLISCITLFISINTAMKLRGNMIVSTDGTDNKSAVPVRVYGFVCNKDGVLWERRREKIDVTEAVWIDGKLVLCRPNKNDTIIDNGSYLMGDKGSFIIDGIKYPRSEIVTQWYKRQLTQWYKIHNQNAEFQN